MKLNFGHGITIALALFIIYIMSFVVQSFQSDVGLVSEDYYAKELEHEDHLNKSRNEQKLAFKIKAEKTANGIELVLPPTYLAQKISGEVEIFRPSNAKMDFIVALNPNADGKVIIPAEALSPGRYKLNIEWVMNDTPYFKSIDIVI